MDKINVDISIIVPVYYESNSVINCYDVIVDEMLKKQESFELIFVDDGSKDDSFFHLNAIAQRDTRVKVIKLATNVGAHMAIRAGLSYAEGKYTCFIACDLQEPPYLISQMKNTMINDVDKCNIIWAVRKSRKDSFFSIFIAKIFYFFSRTMVSKNIPPSGASMFMISKKVLKAVEKYNERNLTLEGLFATIGFTSKFVYYEREDRKSGESKWTFSKKIKLFIDFFVAYSNVPIRLVSVMGISLSFLGIIWLTYVIFRKFAYNDLSLGWASIMSILMIGFGITNISLGIIAEYLWRTLDEARKRPNYVVDEIVNL